MFILNSITICYAQKTKRNISLSALDEWGQVYDTQVSDDGKYAGYITQNGRGDYYNRPKRLTLKSLESNWEKKISTNVIKYAFTGNNKYVIILDSTNQLQLLQLGSNIIVRNYKANYFELFNFEGEEYLIIIAPDQRLYLISTNTERNMICRSIKLWFRAKSNKRIFVLDTKDSLYCIDVKRIQKSFLGKFINISNLTVNKEGDKLAFVMDQTIWMCDVDEKMTARIVTESSFTNMVCSPSTISIDKFSDDNNELYIKLNHRIEPALSDTDLLVWDYRDRRLRSDAGPTNISSFYLIGLKDKKITNLQKSDEYVRFLSDVNTDLLVITGVKGANYEKHWNPASQEKHYIFNRKNKSRQQVGMDPRSLSPDSKFIIGLNEAGTDFISWNINTKEYFKVTNIIGTIPEQDAALGNDIKRWSYAGWTSQHDLLLYDEYDIWQIDLSQLHKPINLTNGIGREFGIKFTLLKKASSDIYNPADLKIIRAFNKKTKQSGYYNLSLKGEQSPTKLVMSDVAFGEYYTKAAKTDLYIVSKQRADSSLNYFVTNNFKTFTPLTNLYPESEFKWLKTELFNFSTTDSKPSQGIIYKPVDFDSSKKYPVVIDIYEKFSDELHSYIEPSPANGEINVPWFVSRGYIIVRPDIQYTVRKPGESALNSVLGAVNYLNTLAYVDSANIGIAGHSWGAFEVNYIISHTNCFKAALSACGNANLITAVTSLTYEGLNYGDVSTYNRYERLGVTLWQQPELYVNNSPVMYAHRISTPVLLMANEFDAAINVQQGMQFFWSLRRLSKPAWLLQYKEEYHTLSDYDNQIDFTEKALSFFDHFLKHDPVEDWMNKPL